MHNVDIKAVTNAVNLIYRHKTGFRAKINE